MLPPARAVEIRDAAADDGLFEHRSGNVVDLFPNFCR
jgi:hypothetical protein